MKNIKICSFVASFTHCIIVSNNFISKEYENTYAKVIYLNENLKSEKVSVLDKYFRGKNIEFYECLNENIVHDYINDNIIFVVYGSEKYIESVNKYINLVNSNFVVINGYNVLELVSSTEKILKIHDYYLNTEGIQIKNNKTCKLHNFGV